jgi:hypothetical protein
VEDAPGYLLSLTEQAARPVIHGRIKIVRNSSMLRARAASGPVDI